MPAEVAEELYRVLQQYDRERKDERVVGEATEQAEADGADPAFAEAGKEVS